MKNRINRKKIAVGAVISMSALLFGAFFFSPYFLKQNSHIRELSGDDIEKRLAQLSSQSKESEILGSLNFKADVRGNGDLTDFHDIGVGLRHPITYTLREESKSDDKDAAVLVAGIGGGRTLAIARYKNSQSLDEFPAVKMRRLKKDAYVERKVTIGTKDFIEFSGTGANFETVLFYFDGINMYSIALSALTSGASEIAAQEYDLIKESIVLDS